MTTDSVSPLPWRLLHPAAPVREISRCTHVHNHVPTSVFSSTDSYWQLARRYAARAPANRVSSARSISQIVTNNRRSHDNVRRQLARLLQQFVVRCQRPLAKQAADSSQCISTCCDNNSQKVRSHLTGAVWTSLASCLLSNRVQVGDDRRNNCMDWRLHIWPTTACLSHQYCGGVGTSCHSEFMMSQRKAVIINRLKIRHSSLTHFYIHSLEKTRFATLQRQWNITDCPVLRDIQ